MTLFNRISSALPVLIISTSLFLLVPFSSCSLLKKVSFKSQTPSDGIDSAKLSASLRLVLDNAFAEVVGTASSIAANTTDRKIRENTLLWKIRAISSFQNISLESDPRAAFLTVWASAVQLRKYLTVGQGKDIFGPQQYLAIQTAEKIESDIVELGRQFFSQKWIDEASDDVDVIADSFTSRDPYAAMDISAISDKKNDILRILSAPLGGLQGVADTPQAINRFTTSTQIFSKIIQDLPERSRWQLELLMLELESLPTVETMVQQMGELQKSIRQISDTAKTLPAETRAEIEKLLVSLEHAQPALQSTLTEFSSAISSAKGALVQADVTVLNIRKTVESLDSVVQQFAQAAQSWEKTASEVRAALADLNTPFDEKSKALQIGLSVEALVNKVFIRAVILIVFIFVMLYIYSRLKHKTIAPKKD